MKYQAKIRNQIKITVGQENLRISPAFLYQTIREKLPETTRAQVRTTIQAMVEAGELVYSHRFSSTQIEAGLSAPLQVSPHIVLNPIASNHDYKAGHIGLRLIKGSSFGCGDHPTTQLSLQGLDLVISMLTTEGRIQHARALDIGTGSGVLAVAAALLGVEKSIGIDIDPTACHEARLNALENGVCAKSALVVGSLECLGTGVFEILMANLRPPTIIAHLSKMITLTRRRGYWILSGYRPEEEENLSKHLAQKFHSVWKAKDRFWCAQVLQKSE